MKKMTRSPFRMAIAIVLAGMVGLLFSMTAVAAPAGADSPPCFQAQTAEHPAVPIEGEAAPELSATSPDRSCAPLPDTERVAVDFDPIPMPEPNALLRPWRLPGHACAGSGRANAATTLNRWPTARG